MSPKRLFLITSVSHLCITVAVIRLNLAWATALLQSEAPELPAFLRASFVLQTLLGIPILHPLAYFLASFGIVDPLSPSYWVLSAINSVAVGLIVVALYQATRRTREARSA